jgi:hypothetical protein
MSLAAPVRETREELIRRAKEAMRRAELETIPNRARIHVQAAETWLKLAARKPRPTDCQQG